MAKDDIEGRDAGGVDIAKIRQAWHHFASLRKNQVGKSEQLIDSNGVTPRCEVG